LQNYGRGELLSSPAFYSIPEATRHFCNSENVGSIDKNMRNFRHQARLLESLFHRAQMVIHQVDERMEEGAAHPFPPIPLSPSAENPTRVEMEDEMQNIDLLLGQLRVTKRQKKKMNSRRREGVRCRRRTRCRRMRRR